MLQSQTIASTTPTTMTAEVFLDSIVRFVRLQHVCSVELCFATEQRLSGAAALTSLALPVLIVVEARLTSSLTWQQEVRSGMSRDKSPENGGSVFTQHVSFLLSSDAAARTTCPSSSSRLPQTELTAQWCAQLQRRLAVCSALTGLPTRLHVSLLPYVPPLTWDRGRDGPLGATHSATMMSTFTETGADGAATAERVVQVALLLNANIPLGSRGGRNTAVLFLHAADGDACFATTSPLLTSREGRKRPRQSTLSEGRVLADVSMKEQQLFPLLTRFTEVHLLPKLSWETVWSRPLQGATDSHDVCGLREQVGCSFYLEGGLDARSVQSITVIVDAPLELWRRALLCDPDVEPSGGDNLLQQLPRCLAKTVEGALSRLAAKNSDFFMNCAAMTSGGVDNEEKEEALESAATVAARTGSGRLSRQLLAQSIADSLAQIVRTSQNRVFVAEVHRLLLMRQGDEGAAMPPTEPGDNSSTSAAATASSSLLPSELSTAALLRWAVEARLMER